MSIAVCRDAKPLITFVAKGQLEAVGEKSAKQVANVLIEGSMWFEVTPMPDDVWLFDTKGEVDHFLKKKFCLRE